MFVVTNKTTMRKWTPLQENGNRREKVKEREERGREGRKKVGGESEMEGERCKQKD